MTPAAEVNPLISTARLRLEPQTAAHADAMFQVLADPRVHTFLPSDPPTTRDVLVERFARLESRRSPDAAELWLNWVVYQQDAAIGTVQASVNLAEASADVAYAFHPSAWGHGYAHEAMRALLAFLHQDLGVQRYRATIDTRNTPSQRLVELLGFAQVRVVKAADESKGSVSDEFIYEREEEGLTR